MHIQTLSRPKFADSSENHGNSLNLSGIMTLLGGNLLNFILTIDQAKGKTHT